MKQLVSFTDVRDLEKIRRYHEQVHQIADVCDMAHALATDFSVVVKLRPNTIFHPWLGCLLSQKLNWATAVPEVQEKPTPGIFKYLPSETGICFFQIAILLGALGLLSQLARARTWVLRTQSFILSLSSHDISKSLFLTTQLFYSWQFIYKVNLKPKTSILLPSTSH